MLTLCSINNELGKVSSEWVGWLGDISTLPPPLFIIFRIWAVKGGEGRGKKSLLTKSCSDGPEAFSLLIPFNEILLCREAEIHLHGRHSIAQKPFLKKILFNSTLEHEGGGGTGIGKPAYLNDPYRYPPLVGGSYAEDIAAMDISPVFPHFHNGNGKLIFSLFFLG